MTDQPAGSTLGEQRRIRPPDPELRNAWITACVLGELIGFVPPALVGTLLSWLDASELLLVAGLVLGGCAEGAVLGAFQARVLRAPFPAVSGWTGATALAAGIAWLAGMGGSSLVQAVGPASLILAVPGWVVGLLAMGVLQSRRLAAVANVSTLWISRTTGAWLIGVMIPVAALSVVPNGAHPAIHFAVAVAAAVAMGATVGLITGSTLVQLAGRPTGTPSGP
jgi:hypothetical protein